MFKKILTKSVAIIFLTGIFFGALIYVERNISLEGEGNIASSIHTDTGVVNRITGPLYGFVFGGGAGALLGDFSCDTALPRTKEDTDHKLHTYCQNTGSPVKVGLAWKEMSVQKAEFLKRVANTIVSQTGEDGTFECKEDRTFVSDGYVPGVVSDCTILVDDTKQFYASTYFFYPHTDAGVSQVLYTYSIVPTHEKTIVEETLRTLAREIGVGILPVSFLGAHVAYAEEGGGGDGGGDGGSGDGGGDGGGGDGSGGGDAGGDGGSGDGSGDAGGDGDSGDGSGDSDGDGNGNIGGGVDGGDDNGLPGDSGGGGGQPPSDLPPGDVPPIDSGNPPGILPPTGDTPPRGGGGGGGDRDTPPVVTPPPRGFPSQRDPELWADKTIVRNGESVTLHWDTHNGDEGLCVLTGGTLGSSHTPIPHVNGTSETGSVLTTIQGVSRYVLNCSGRTDVITIEMIPEYWES